MKLFVRLAAAAMFSVLTLTTATPVMAQANVLRVVPHSNLAILDPIWTTAYIAVTTAT